MKSVLTTAGQWMNNSDGDVDEESLLVKALRVSILSKLTYRDRQSFEEIIKDNFPHAKIETVEQREFREAALVVLKEMNLVELPYQVEKSASNVGVN